MQVLLDFLVRRNIDQLNAKQLVSLAGIILNSIWKDEVRAINAEELIVEYKIDYVTIE